MANKKKKKVAKKTAKKKVVKKKVAKKAKPIVRAATPKAAKKTFTLHEKKLAIMEKYPIMPCSILTNDRAGNAFAHTKADEIVGIYARACVKHRLVYRMIENEMTDVDIGSHKGSRANCKFEMTDVDTGESETFCGAAKGDNWVWSDNSAQTVATKQALLIYFGATWPQPDEFVAVAKDYMKKLPTDRFVDAIKEITPPAVMTDADAMEQLDDFYKNVTENQDFKK